MCLVPPRMQLSAIKCNAERHIHAGKLQASSAKGALMKTSEASLLLKDRAQRAQQAITALLAAESLPDQGCNMPACLARLQRVLSISTPQSADSAGAADRQAPAGLQRTRSGDVRSKSAAAGAALGLCTQTDLAGLATGIASIPDIIPRRQSVGRPGLLTAAAGAAQRSMPHPAACASLMRQISAHSGVNPALAASLGQRLTQVLPPAPARGAKVRPACLDLPLHLTGMPCASDV